MPAEGSAFESVIGDLSARFAGIEPTRFDEEVDRLPQGGGGVVWHGPRVVPGVLAGPRNARHHPRLGEEAGSRTPPAADGLAELSLVLRAAPARPRRRCRQPARRVAPAGRRRARVFGASRDARHSDGAVGCRRADPVRDLDGGFRRGPGSGPPSTSTASGSSATSWPVPSTESAATPICSSISTRFARSATASRKRTCRCGRK